MQELLAYRRAHIPKRFANGAREAADDLILQMTVLKVFHGLIVLMVSKLRSGADLPTGPRGGERHLGADHWLDCLGHGQRTVRADAFA
jgi:hypothetical protein